MECAVADHKPANARATAVIYGVSPTCFSDVDGRVCGVAPCRESLIGATERAGQSCTKPVCCCEALMHVGLPMPATGPGCVPGWQATARLCCLGRTGRRKALLPPGRDLVILGPGLLYDDNMTPETWDASQKYLFNPFTFISHFRILDCLDYRAILVWSGLRVLITPLYMQDYPTPIPTHSSTTMPVMISRPPVPPSSADSIHFRSASVRTLIGKTLSPFL